MRDEQVYVIKNMDGCYVNAKFNALFDGFTTGFIFYNSNNEALQEDLERLGVGYYSERVNFNDIPEGKRIYTT